MRRMVKELGHEYVEYDSEEARSSYSRLLAMELFPKFSQFLEYAGKFGNFLL